MGKKAELSAERVLMELMRVAFSDVGDVLDFSGDEPRMKPANQIPARARKAISSIKVKRYLIDGEGDVDREVEITEYKFWDKPAALEKLAKHLGMLTERVKVEGRIDHLHGHFNLDEHLDELPLEVAKALLELTRRKREEGNGLLTVESSDNKEESDSSEGGIEPCTT